jgi:thiopeptide-type bacteriocin biosynthesis protein
MGVRKGTAVRADFFVLRIPLLAFDVLRAWSDGARAPATVTSGDEALTAALAEDRQMLRDRLSRMIDDDQIAGAFEVASLSLVEGIRHWRENPESRQGRSAERSLVRYLARMATRTTPFGLFAGYLIGEVGGPAALELAPRHELKLRARIDLGLLDALVERSLDRAKGDERVLLRRNPLLYRAGGQVRVPTLLPAKDGQERRRRRIVALRATPSIDAVLAAAASPVRAGDLVARLETTGVDPEESRALVRRLVDRQALVPASGLTTTGGDPTTQAIAALTALGDGAGPTAVVRQVGRDLASLEGDWRGTLRTAAAELGRDGFPQVSRHPIQLDSSRPGVARLPMAVVHELRRAADLLARISAPRGASALANFRSDFERRFGTRLVPLAEALDPDYGIVLRDGLNVRRGHDAYDDAARTGLLLELIERGRAAPDGEVELSDADINELTAATPPALPNAFAVAASILASGPEALEAGEFAVAAPTVGGPSGARLLGRFCDQDADLTGLVRAHLKKEEALDPDAIFAELVTVPDTTWGLNVTHRPVLRGWEIECGGSSGADPERRIDLDDLLVGVDEGEIVLRSRRLGRRVVVGATTAVNFEHVSLPAARLLELLAKGRAGALSWSWGVADRAAWLPRVRRGRTILSLARWQIGQAEGRRLCSGSDAARYRRLQEWREERGMPRFVALDTGESPLAFDLLNVLSVDTFFTALERAGRLRLVEVPQADGSPVRGPDGHYVNEVVVPMVRTAAVRPARPRSRPASAVLDAARRFPPGSEWLFAKLYCGPAAADNLLRTVVAPLRRRLREEGAVDRWFFIRYADPDHHLRVRLHGNPSGLIGEVVPILGELAEVALADGRVHRIALDTYEREVERYGGLSGVELMERAAEADSDAVLVALDHPGLERRHLAAASVAALYEDAGLDLHQRHACCVTLREGRMRERGVSAGALLAADERAERPAVASVVESLGDKDAPPAVQALRGRSAALRPTLDQLRDLARDGRLERDLHDVLCTLAHMQVNRMLRKSGGHDELRVHDALARLYESQLARLRSTAAPPG